MKYSELLQKGVDKINSIEIEKASIFSGIKHIGQLFYKLEKPLSNFDINSIDFVYAVEIWYGDNCVFRDCEVHKPEIGLDMLKENVSKMVFDKMFATAIFSALNTAKEFSQDTSMKKKKQSGVAQDFDLLMNFRQYLGSREGATYPAFPDSYIHEYIESFEWEIFRGIAMKEVPKKNLIEEMAPVIKDIQESHTRLMEIIDRTERID